MYCTDRTVPNTPDGIEPQSHHRTKIKRMAPNEPRVGNRTHSHAPRTIEAMAEDSVAASRPRYNTTAPPFAMWIMIKKSPIRPPSAAVL